MFMMIRGCWLRSNAVQYIIKFVYFTRCLHHGRSNIVDSSVNKSNKKATEISFPKCFFGYPGQLGPKREQLTREGNPLKWKNCVGRKPTHVGRKPAHIRRSGMPTDRTLDSQVRTVAPYHLGKELFSNSKMFLKMENSIFMCGYYLNFL